MYQSGFILTFQPEPVKINGLSFVRNQKNENKAKKGNSFPKP